MLSADGFSNYDIFELAGEHAEGVTFTKPRRPVVMSSSLHMKRDGAKNLIHSVTTPMTLPFL
jgi:hypothetical protein